MSIDPKLAEKILNADLANILKKVQAGKTLSATERAIIRAHGSGTEEPVAFASTKAELARQLGISRQNLNKLAKEETFPKADEAGRWNVSACMEWMKATGRTGEEPAEGIDKNEEEAMSLRADRMMREHKLAEARRDVIHIDEVKRTYTRAVFAAKSKLLASERGIGLKLKMRMQMEDDRIEAVLAIVKEENLQFLREMSKGEWLLHQCPKCKEVL